MSEIQSAPSVGINKTQENENRNFDKLISILKEKISSLEKKSEDTEGRLRELERFKYIVFGIGIVGGIILTTFFRWILSQLN